MKLVGKVKDAHGLKGELYVMVFSGDISWLPALKTCEIKTKLDLQPLAGQVQRVKPFKDGFILKLAEINDRTAAEKYKGAEFSVSEDLFISREGETIYLSEILNFKLKDKEQNLLGQIVAFSSNGVQDLLVVKKEKSESQVDIPFVDAFIKKIDWKNQTLVMDLPEGMMDIDKVDKTEKTPKAEKAKTGKALKAEKLAMADEALLKDTGFKTEKSEKSSDSDSK